MGTETEQALIELRGFLDAEDITYDDDATAIRAVIEAYDETCGEKASVLDTLDKEEERALELEEELEGLVGQMDAARSLWNLILNLSAEFDVPATVRPEVTGVDLAGCERVVESLARIVRSAIKAGHGELR